MPFFSLLQRSLKARIALLTLVVSWAGVWALVFYADQRLRQDIQAQLQAQQLSVTSLLAQGLERAVQERVTGLQTVADALSPLIQEPSPTAALQRLLISRPLLQQTFSGGTFVVDAGGEVLASVPLSQDVSAQHLGFSSYILQSLSGVTTISHPLPGPIEHIPVVAIATPVRGADGTVRGALVGLVNLSQPNFVEAVQLLGDSQAGDYYVVARQTRTIITAHDRRRALEALPPAGHNPLIDHLIKGTQGSATGLINGQAALASVQHIPLPDWLVLVVQPTAQVFAPLDTIRQHIIWAALALTALTTAGMWGTLRHELRPLERMAAQLGAMAHEIARDAPDQPHALHPLSLSVQGQDEIGQLARGINHLLSQLRQRQQAMRESEDRYRTAFMTSPDALDITTIREGQHLEINEGFEQLFGWSREQVLQHSGLELGIWRDAAAREKLVHQVLRQGQCRQQEQELFHRDGSALTVLLSARLMQLQGQPCILWATHDITAYRQAYAQIERLTSTDTLTGLPNEAQFIQRLIAMQTQCLERHQLGALLCLDVDDFKSVNDAHGRDHGDQFLQTIAQRLQQALQEQPGSVVLARLGADQFLVLLGRLPPVLAAHDAQQRAVHLQQALAEPIVVDGVVHTPSMSVGILVWGQGYQEPKELVRRAVLALNQAKNAGPNTIVFFESQMQDQIRSRAHLQRSLREALHKESFLLFYQPQWSDAGAVVGVEALVRWPLEGWGMVSPAEFIPLAEKTGLIVPLGYWVLQTACRQLAVWAKNSPRCTIDMAVNVSAWQFQQENFVQQVQQVLIETGAPAQHLKLELTESVMMDDMEQVIQHMKALKNLGVRFSIDDFGTGFSSLAYLKRLPLAQLKIDQSFVRDILEDHNAAAIAQTIIALGQSLGLSVIAEGVETQLHCDKLKQWGCCYYQGYFFSKPLPIEKLELFLENHTKIITV